MVRINVSDHINKTGQNPLIKKQNKLKIEFIDTTKIYTKQKKEGVVTTSLGQRFNKKKKNEKYPSTYISNVAIICKAIGFKKITGKLINFI